MSIRFDDQVVIVTGAANGLGKSHALEFARRGARVVVNDLGGSRDGSGGSGEAAESVVSDIEQAGGEAMANGANVADYAQVETMVKEALERWGRVDVLVNNAGILRDKTFAKMELDDFKRVLDVHLMGAVNCTKAVWETMRAQEYGRIVMTSSSSGIYGNFGQTNYSAAKMGLIGFMNTLAIEGQKYAIKVNSLAPIAATRMTEDLLPPNVLGLLQPEAVTPAVIFMASEGAPTRQIIAAGAGVFARVVVQETPGVFLPPENRDAEHVAAAWEQIANTDGQSELTAGGDQTMKFLQKAAAELGIRLD
ncbi:MAG: SDR family NAD(P)-dependent oxidoreductase [Proteobacteria bacterium]|nr:SDR family NAD(P)-dependent oxidoreductase [Pseudomonadota bacterium]